MNTITHLLALLSAAIIAIQIAYDSTLCQRIKQKLFGKNLTKQSKLETYYIRMTDWVFFLLTPVWVVVYLFANIYEFIKELVDCAYCTAFWLGIVVGLVLQQPLIITIIYAPIAIAWVYLLEKLINE